jgi:hypothetical protein
MEPLLRGAGMLLLETLWLYVASSVRLYDQAVNVNIRIDG